MVSRIGIIGCGAVSDTYIRGSHMFPWLDIAACGDINMDAARAKAGMFGIEARETDAILSDPSIDTIINLTVPKAHARTSETALVAGKHVYSEKPLGTVRADARQLLETARARGLRLGCAPDTFLGAAQQTCRKLVDEGWIGRPHSGTMVMMNSGIRGRQPLRQYLLEEGGGPLFDVGPYYITAFINLLGPVKSVIARTALPNPNRICTNRNGLVQELTYGAETFAAGILEFACGAIVTALFSWDTAGHSHPDMEIYGTEAALQMSNPGYFGGGVRIRYIRGGWQDVALIDGYTEESRILGCADMMRAIGENRRHRASAGIAYHVLDIMCAFEESSKCGRAIELESTCERPEPLLDDMFAPNPLACRSQYLGEANKEQQACT